MAIQGFNIDGFKSNGLQLGGARSSLFSVDIVLPAALGIDQEIARKFSFTCRAAEVPAMTIGTIEVPYFGRRVKIAGDRTFADWTVTVMNDEDYAVRASFESWQSAINEMIGNIRTFDTFVNETATPTNPGGQARPQAGTGYKQTAVVTQYGKAGGILRQYELVGVYPTDIGAIALDWDNQNQIETFPVTFAYDYWIPVQSSQAPATLGGLVAPQVFTETNSSTD